MLQCPSRNNSKVNTNSPCEVFHIEGPFIEANLAVAVFLSHTSTVMLQFPALSLGNCSKVCTCFFFRNISSWIETVCFYPTEELFIVTYSPLMIVSFGSGCGVIYSLNFPVLHFTFTTF